MVHCVNRLLPFKSCFIWLFSLARSSLKIGSPLGGFTPPFNLQGDPLKVFFACKLINSYYFNPDQAGRYWIGFSKNDSKQLVLVTRRRNFG
jgi:hypothetical protein